MRRGVKKTPGSGLIEVEGEFYEFLVADGSGHVIFCFQFCF